MTESETSPRDDRIDEAIAAYLHAVERGENPDREVFLQRHADIADELRSFLSNVAQFQKLARSESAGIGLSSVDRTPADKQSDQASDPDEPTMTFDQRDVRPTKTVLRYFGDYELIDEIARGDMGVVYQARQVTLNRIVAVKMILAGNFAGPEEVQRFYTKATSNGNKGESSTSESFRNAVDSSPLTIESTN